MIPGNGQRFEVPVSEMLVNADQRLICVTEDKVLLCLHRHGSKLQSRREWITPAVILLTIGLSLVTTDFKKEALGVGSETWTALFIMLACASAGWLLFALVRLPARLSPEQLLDELCGRGKA
jgi:hypothetical protein